MWAKCFPPVNKKIRAIVFPKILTVIMVFFDRIKEKSMELYINVE